MRRFLGIAAIPLLLLLAAKGAEALIAFSWNSFVGYESVYANALPYGQPSPVLSNQVVIVVADGLRVDASLAMPTLNKLRTQGADLVATTGEPSLSLPGWTTLASGAYPETSGVVTNWHKGAAKVDSIFQEAKRQGLTTAVVGSASWQKLFGAYIDHSYAIDTPPTYGNVAAVRQIDEEIMTRAIALLREKRPNLLLVHLHGPDYAGHSYGGASAWHRESALSVDSLLSLLVQEMDLAGSTIVFTSDHGHLDEGGHGGGEPSVRQVPLVIAGKGAKGASAVKEVGQVDIAPTVSILLGMPVPYHSQGRALLEAIDASGTLKGEQGLAVARELKDFYDAYAAQVGGPPFARARLVTAQPAIATGDPAALAAYHTLLTADAQTARANRLANERILRFPLGLIAFLLPAVYLWRIRPRRALGLPLLGAAVYFGLFYLLFFGRGYRWSLSTFNYEERIPGFFRDRALDAMIAVALGAIVVSVLSRHKTAWETAEAVVNTSFLVVYLLFIQVLAFFVLYDVRFPWYLPDPAFGIKAYLDLLQIVATGWPVPYMPLAAILPLFGIGLKLIAARLPARQRGAARSKAPAA